MNATPLAADIMISHAWGEDMGQVEQILKDEQAVADGTAVWFCIFAIYQPGGSCEDGGDGCGPSINEQLCRSPFRAVIERATMMLVLHTTTAHVGEEWGK